MGMAGAANISVTPVDSSKPWDTGYEWKAVILLTLGFGLVGLDRWVIADLAGAKASTMVPDLHLSNPPAQIGYFISALGIAWGVAAMFMGNLSDRFGRRKVIVPALILFSVLSGVSGLTGGFLAMIFMRSLMGVSEGAYAPTSFATVAEASKPERRGFNLGLQQSAFALFGLGFGPIIATQLLTITSWRWVFAIVGVPGLIVALLVALTIREPATIATKSNPNAVAGPKLTLSDLFKHRNVPLSMLALLCAMCGIFVLSAFSPQYLTGYLKLSDQQMGFVTSAIGFGGFLGQWGLSALSDFLGRKLMAILGFTIGAAFLVIFKTMDGSNTLLLFVVLFISAGSSFGLLSLITGPIATEAAPLGLIASTGGVIIGIGEIFGGGVAPGVGGAIAGRFGIQHTLDLALGGLVVGIIVSLFYKETAPRKVGRSADESALDQLEDEVGGISRV
jgi:predicted MFS family arabinose efflux permease